MFVPPPFSANRRRGISLIEIVLGVGIFVAAMVPLYTLFSGSNRQYERMQKQSLAQFVARSVLERITAQAPTGLGKIPVHNEFLAVVPGSNRPVSPWFTTQTRFEFSASNTPVLMKDLREFGLSVQLLPVAGASDQPVRLARIEVSYGKNANDEPLTLLLQTLVSEYATL